MLWLPPWGPNRLDTATRDGGSRKPSAAVGDDGRAAMWPAALRSGSSGSSTAVASSRGSSAANPSHRASSPSSAAAASFSSSAGSAAALGRNSWGGSGSEVSAASSRGGHSSDSAAVQVTALGDAVAARRRGAAAGSCSSLGLSSISGYSSDDGHSDDESPSLESEYSSSSRSSRGSRSSHHLGDVGTTHRSTGGGPAATARTGRTAEVAARADDRGGGAAWARTAYLIDKFVQSMAIFECLDPEERCVVWESIPGYHALLFVWRCRPGFDPWTTR